MNNRRDNKYDNKYFKIESYVQGHIENLRVNAIKDRRRKNLEETEEQVMRNSQDFLQSHLQKLKNIVSKNDDLVSQLPEAKAGNLELVKQLAKEAKQNVVAVYKLAFVVEKENGDIKKYNRIKSNKDPKFEPLTEKHNYTKQIKNIYDIYSKYLKILNTLSPKDAEKLNKELLNALEKENIPQSFIIEAIAVEASQDINEKLKSGRNSNRSSVSSEEFEEYVTFQTQGTQYELTLNRNIEKATQTTPVNEFKHRNHSISSESSISIDDSEYKVKQENLKYKVDRSTNTSPFDENTKPKKLNLSRSEISTHNIEQQSRSSQDRIDTNNHFKDHSTNYDARYSELKNSNLHPSKSQTTINSNQNNKPSNKDSKLSQSITERHSYLDSSNKVSLVSIVTQTNSANCCTSLTRGLQGKEPNQNREDKTIRSNQSNKNQAKIEQANARVDSRLFL